MRASRSAESGTRWRAEIVRDRLWQDSVVRSEPAAQQLRETVGLFDRLAAGERRHRRGAAVAEQPLDDVERVVPGDRLEAARPGLAERCRDPVAGEQVLVGEAAFVAEPALVDLRMDPGLDSLDLALARRGADVAADGTEAADGRHVLDLPRTRLESILGRGECADRADLGDVAGEVAAVRLVLERRDHRLRAAVHGDELPVLGDLLAEARAAVAEDAALAVECDQRRDRDRLLERALREDHAGRAGPVAKRQVLERALAALVADRAVERVVDEDELECRVLAFCGDLRRPGRVHDHPVLRRQCAARLQLRHALDLDEAHAAGADGRAEPRLVAEHGNLDAGGLRRLDQAGALRNLHRALVDRDGDHVGGRARHA